MSILTKGNVKPDVVSIKQTANDLGIKLPKTDDPETLVVALRKAFESRLPENRDECVLCPKCGEVTDDDPLIRCCPFCGDEGEDDAEEASEDDDAGEDEDDTEDDDAGEDDEDDAAEDEDTDLVEASELDQDDEGDLKQPEEVVVEDSSDEESEAESDDEESDDEESDDEESEDESDSDEGVLAPQNEEELAAYKELESFEEVIDREQKNMTSAGYDLGVAIKEVQTRHLWKSKFKSFRAFTESKGISYTLAYGLIDLVGKFDRETFVKVGQTKLLIVAKADEKDRKDLLKEAETKSKRELIERTRPETKKDKERVVPKKENDKAEKEDQKITLLAKVGGKPRKLVFKSTETTENVDSIGPDTYLDLRISDDVAVIIGFTEKNGKIVNAIASFKRAAEVDAMAETVAKVAGVESPKPGSDVGPVEESKPEASDEFSEAWTDDAPKKKRGRPAKAKVEQSDDAPKKKRGRPAKAKVEQSDDAPKKKRGRPAKAK
jgi:hypothetical protein